ncbi:retroviral-like aspartic protease family protein [Lewinella sp. LCG006]|uniref:retroviral-like aspartic protease family protein n=1 Tax=Lewinella sp. LCG006 TaxID=3231911 RepID=UPI00345F85D5
MKKLIPLFVIVSLLASCSTLHRIKSNRLVTQATLATTNFYSTIDYELKEDLPILTVEIEGKPYRFFFDTGGYTVLSEALIKALKGVRQISHIDVKDGNEQTNRIFTYQLEALSIGGVRFEEVGFAKIGFTESEWFSCLGVDGTLGPNIMKECLWLFATDEQKIILTDQASRLPAYEKGIEVACSTTNINKPLLDFSFAEYSSTLTFDTGFNGYLKLAAITDSTHYQKYPSVEKMGQFFNAGHSKEQRNLIVLQLDSVNVSGLNLQAPISSLDMGSTSSLLGSEIFRSHNVLFDLSGKEITFFPREAPQLINKLSSFGFGFNYEARRITVGYVYKPSAAYTAGVLPGDEIVSIDGTVYNFTDYCDFVTNFDLPAKEKITLELKRAGGPVSIELTKAPLF